MSTVVEEWAIDDEFAQRLGCGVLTAAVLPLWFLLLLFGVESSLAVTATTVLLVVTVVAAVLAVRRARRVPRLVQLDEDGTLVTVSRAGLSRRPLGGLTRVDLGTSLGMWPMRLTFDDGTVWRLPRELDDLDGFLATMADRRPGLTIVDHNPPRPGAGGGGDG